MRITEHVALDRYSTLRVGGHAQALTAVSTLDDLRQALAWAEDRGLPWFILGGGTNFFCRPEGFPGLVIKMENRGLTVGNRQETGGRRQELTVEAGVITRLAVLGAVEHGLRGIEHLAGIPGTIGGAVRGNAGAFGVEAKDFLKRVRVLRRSSDGWTEDVLPLAQITFGYRQSTFKEQPREFVVWEVTFLLSPGDRAEGERLVADDLAARRAKQPYEFPSVGSIFKNPSPDRSAGSLIEAASLKGTRIGGAEVSTKHANFIVNRGGAIASDVVALIAVTKQRVFDTHGVRLEEEIVVL